ncbi:hypothetical protein EMIT0194P_20499 [Pseudomonas serbica]
MEKDGLSLLSAFDTFDSGIGDDTDTDAFMVGFEEIRAHCGYGSAHQSRCVLQNGHGFAETHSASCNFKSDESATNYHDVLVLLNVVSQARSMQERTKSVNAS